MKIGEQIRMLRKNENLSQEQLGQKLNVTRQAIYKWENDKGYPDIQNLITLSELFDISIDELIKKDSAFQGRIKVKGGIISNRRLLASLNYFSIFFSPFIFPLITMRFGESDIKDHGRRAFLSHSIPVALYVIMVIVVYLSAYITGADQPNSILIISGAGFLALITLGVAIWNVVQGVKVLKNSFKT
jgi:transcriptional regulator with XRE-family HTH domain